MRNFVRDGKQIPVTLPDNVESGELVIINDLKGVAMISGHKDDTAVIETRGVFEFNKIDEEIMQGEKAYYRKDIKLVTKQSNHLKGKDEVGHPLIGVFTANAKGEDKKAQVMLV